MHAELGQAYNREMRAATEAYAKDDLDKAFFHLERAHILGQSFTLPHTKAHWWMLKVGWKRRDFIEISGQIIRAMGALSFSRIWVPVGNTGGTNVSPFRSMQIPEEFQSLLSRHGRG